jgi:hypothetical protein
MLLLHALAALVAAALLAALLLPPPRLPSGVPHVPGAPLLGSLPGFARDTSGWLRRQAAARGSAFAAYLLRGPCLFLTNPADFAGVWRKTRELSFHEVELDMNKKVLSLAPLACAAAVDQHAHSLWTRHLSGTALPAVAATLAAELVAQASGVDGSVAAQTLGSPDADGWRSCALYDLVYRLLWAAGMRSVVGGLTRTEVAALLEPFRAFDAGFPMLAGGIPHAMLGKAVEGRRTIAAAMLKAMRRGDTADGDAPALSGLARDRAAHFAASGVSDADSAALNGLLAWPLHANSAPAAFWTLAHTLADAATLAAVQKEVDAFVAEHPGFAGGAEAALTPALLDASLPLASACCLEALRLAGSSFGLRIATETAEVPLAPHAGHPARVARVEPGTRVFLASLGHADDARFPDAALFRPHRFLPGGGASAGDVLAFGGGASMCPGRHFALMELRLVLVAMLSRWELRLCEPGLPPLHAQRAGLGVLPPERDVRAQARLRTAA